MRCSGPCKRELPAGAFSKRTDRPRGRSSLCKSCRREASKRWYAKHIGQPAPLRLLPTPAVLPCCYRGRGGCPNESTWHDPFHWTRWSACDLHKIPGDVRIDGSDDVKQVQVQEVARKVRPRLHSGERSKLLTRLRQGQ